MLDNNSPLDVHKYLLPLLVTLVLTGCDSGPRDYEEWKPAPSNDVIEAQTNLPKTLLYRGFSQMSVCRAGSAQPDTVFTVGQSIYARDGYSHGFWYVLFVKRGGALVPVRPDYVPDGGARPLIWYSNLNEVQGDAGVAELRLDTTAQHTVRIDRFDPVTHHMEGAFEARFVFHSGSPRLHPARNFADTVSFRGGTFHIEPEVSPCIP